MTTKPVSRFKAATTLTISGGAISIVQGVHVVAAEAGTADDLDTINNGIFNMELFLMADSGDTITIKDGTGNIETGDGNDVDLDGDKVAHLLYDVANTAWKVVAVSATGGSNSGTSVSNVLESHTASNSATLEFDVSAQNGAVEFILESIVPATDGADLTIEVSDDNGSTWESTNYQWGNGYEESNNDPAAYGGATSTATGNTDAIYITGSMGSDTGEGGFGHVLMDNPSNASLYKNLKYEMGYLAAGGQSVKSTGSGMWKGSVNAITNVRFKFDSGNIESGTIKMIDPTIAQSGSPSLFEADEVRIPGEWWQDPNNMSDYYPKYRKVVDLGALPDATTKDVAHGLTNVHWDSLTISGSAYNSGSSYVQPINTPDPSSNASAISCILAGTTNLEVETGVDRTSYTGYAILEYAKTTDTPVTRAQAYGNGGAGLIDGHSFVMLSADQSSGLSVGDEIEFDDEQAGNIPFNPSTFQWTLSAGKTYHLSCTLQIQDSSTSGRLECMWYDVTNSTNLGAKGAPRSMDTESSYSNISSCEAVVKPTSDITVEVRITSVTDVNLVASDSSRAYIQQIA